MSKIFIKMEVGRLDEKGKLIFSKTYKRMTSPEDKPLDWIANIVNNVIMPLIGYSSPEAAKADVAAFKEWANGMEAVPPTEGLTDE